MKLKTGRNNLAVTLFVPWDCGNNCPFCTTKQEYKDSANFSLSEQINTLYQIWGVDDVKDIVITGGESFCWQMLQTGLAQRSVRKREAR